MSNPGLLQRTIAAVGYAVTGSLDWFGPLNPLPPVAPEREAGRQLDYPVGYNLQQRPRTGEALSFQDLRNFAGAYDLLRLIIETRKDQISVLDWTIQSRDEKKKPNRKCKALTDFFQQPDREHDWADWVRMLLEDMLVIDAPTLYVRRTLGGEVHSFEPIDGATVKRVIDHTGRTPQPPDPAYQQVLKGLPAIDYTTDEIVYRPRNPRPHKIYGYSPVEQVVATVNIALRRQVWTLKYFDEGSIPEALASVPKEWGVEQIRQFQEYWDSLLAGDMAARRRLTFIPDGTAYHPTKDPQHFDTFDEWLARIVCFAFSIPPTPFVRQMNRATAQTTTEQALKEGQEPVKRWLKALHDYLLRRFLNAPDLEFCWKQQADIDPLTQAQIHGIYRDKGILADDEIRADIGREPKTPEQRALEMPAITPGQAGQESENQPAQEPEEDSDE